MNKSANLTSGLTFDKVGYLNLGSTFHLINYAIIISVIILLIFSLPLPRFLKNIVKAFVYYKIGNAESKSGFGIRLSYLFIAFFAAVLFSKSKLPLVCKQEL